MLVHVSPYTFMVYKFKNNNFCLDFITFLLQKYYLTLQIFLKYSVVFLMLKEIYFRKC